MIEDRPASVPQLYANQALHCTVCVACTLMTGYYRNLKQGMGRGEALRAVQLDMLKRNPKLHPFYWANFIQSGD